MATASHTLRHLCRHSSRRLLAPALRTTSNAGAAASASSPVRRIVPFSTTTPQRDDSKPRKRSRKGAKDEPGTYFDDVIAPLTPEQLQWMDENIVQPRLAGSKASQPIFGSAPLELPTQKLEELYEDGPPPRTVQELLDQDTELSNEVRREVPDLVWTREAKPNPMSFWYDEDDPNQIAGDPGEEFDENDITEMAHAKLDEIRDERKWLRVMAWEMPLLAKLAKPFEPPSDDQVLRFRYTSYMGEFHPAEKKVVVQFCPGDLGLTPVQEEKLKKLAGARYNPEKDIVHMGCESFDHQAQNKRFLLDTITKLVQAAKDPADTMEDIPLDTRHHVSKTKPKFPAEWRMTKRRKEELATAREAAGLIDTQRQEQGLLVDGTSRVEQYLAAQAAAEAAKAAEALPEMVAVPLSDARGRGRGRGQARPL